MHDRVSDHLLFEKDFLTLLAILKITGQQWALLTGQQQNPPSPTTTAAAREEPGIQPPPPLLVGFFFDFDDSSTTNNSFDFSQRNSFRVDPIPETAMPRCTTVELGA